MANEKISEGDYVLLCLDPRRTYMVKVEAGKSFHTHKGFIKLDELIGKEFGAVVQSSLGIEFTALKPSLTDYIMKSSRKTQITYPKDAALIVMFSGIGPGSRVVESGTGTGALTTALAHYVKPEGRVYSYELREEFQKNAEKNLKRANLLDFVELKSGDVTAGIEGTILGKQGHRLRRGGSILENLDRLAPGLTLRAVNLPKIEHLPLNNPPTRYPAVLHHVPVTVLFTILLAICAT